MVTYLACFIVCDFVFAEKLTKIHGTKFRVYATPNQRENVQYALDIGANITDFFTDYFDVSLAFFCTSQLHITYINNQILLSTSGRLSTPEARHDSDPRFHIWSDGTLGLNNVQIKNCLSEKPYLCQYLFLKGIGRYIYSTVIWALLRLTSNESQQLLAMNLHTSKQCYL